MSRNGKGVEGTVGSLLAIIAHSIQDALRTLIYADKRAWGSPEFEQLRLLEETLEEAKRDFQELPALVNGRLYYENDRKGMCYYVAKFGRGLCTYTRSAHRGYIPWWTYAAHSPR